MQFEYRRRLVKQDDKWEMIMDNMGALGWELVGWDDLVYVFKREKLNIKGN